jgi:hypothetical protein
MENQTQAASSTATVEAPLQTFDIPRSGTPEYAQWRIDGSLPEKKQPKPAESAPADTEKDQKTDDSADSAATQTQEQRQGKRRPDVETRFTQLSEQYKREIAELRQKLEEATKPKTQADSSPAKPAQPQTYKEWRDKFKPSQWIEAYSKEHPDATYEDANAAMADYLGDVRDQFRTLEQQRESQAKEFNAKVNDAKARYGDTFEQKVAPAAKAINADAAVPQTVKQMLNESEYLPDILFTLGGDPAALQNFIETAKTSPGKALRYIAALEANIAEELSKASSNRNEQGQFTAKQETAPAKRGPESAPDPPIEIGSRGTGTMDESQRALQAIERGNASAFRQFKAAEDRKELARRRGV